MGALPRTIQQAQNEAAYNEWLRSTQQYPLEIAQLAQSLATQQPILAQQGYEQSPFSQIANVGLPIALASILSGGLAAPAAAGAAGAAGGVSNIASNPFALATLGLA